jgi:N-methylhydantoinase A/oxoprolinase/acetone carboxylase beta subunit
MKIGIGIDTGGTCTDAVAYDFEAGTLLAKGKALTTRENLSVGIGQALDMLPPEYIKEASLITLSTTLATNACVENKGSRAKLLIFGLTDEFIRRFDAETIYGFRYDSVRCIDTHGSANGLVIDEPDWDAVIAENGHWLRDADALSAAELYAIANGAPCERRAKKLAEELYGLPLVCASELTSEIDVLTRGATALLNARLLPIVREFIEAALSDFAARQCKAPVMVVRSDGSLMSANLSLSRPVETILSGPAASVLAGRNAAGDEDYLIIDMGGTTTDVSVVSHHKPVMADSGIRIGGWRTHVKGVFVDTFALGGDSAVRLKGDQVSIFPRRVKPICSAATRWPEIKTMLWSCSARTAHPSSRSTNSFILSVSPRTRSATIRRSSTSSRLSGRGPSFWGASRHRRASTSTI